MERGSSSVRATRLGCACECGREHGGGWRAGPRVFKWWGRCMGGEGGLCLTFRAMAAASDLLTRLEEHRSYLRVDLSLLGLPAALPELHLR